MTVWLWLYKCMTMTVMTENKLETNQQQEEQQQQVEKWYLELLLAVKKSFLLLWRTFNHTHFVNNYMAKQNVNFD
jgi:hypothetical protein